MAVYRLWTGDQGLGVRDREANIEIHTSKDKLRSADNKGAEVSEICRFMKMSLFQMKSLVKHAD